MVLDLKYLDSRSLIALKKDGLIAFNISSDFQLAIEYLIESVSRIGWLRFTGWSLLVVGGGYDMHVCLG